MPEMTSGHWLVLVIALVLVILVAWWLLAASRRTRIERTETPAEDLPAQRNRALIDAPPASAGVALPPPTPEVLGGVSEVVAASTRPVPPPPQGDELKRIKGVGPKLEALLKSLGVTTYSQIAAWDDAEIERIDAQLGAFQGRIRRDDWPAQARLLAAGDSAGFEQRFGRL